MMKARAVGTWMVLAVVGLGCASEGPVAAKDGSGGQAAPQPGASAGAQANTPPPPPPAARGPICSLLPCSDHAVVSAELSAASASAGSQHVFELDVDGAKKRCTVTYDPANRQDATCTGGGASLLMGPKMEQKTLEVGGMVGITEVPIPGRATWQLTLAGRPKSVRVIHTSGPATVVDKSATLTYAEERPNGAGCEPACQVASVSWKIS